MYWDLKGTINTPRAKFRYYSRVKIGNNVLNAGCQ